MKNFKETIDNGIDKLAGDLSTKTKIDKMEAESAIIDAKSRLAFLFMGLTQTGFHWDNDTLGGAASMASDIQEQLGIVSDYFYQDSSAE